MAITWKDKEGNVIETTHEGLVISERYTRCVRVMSDIYSDETYCAVWNPETGQIDNVHINSCFELFTGPYGVAVPDLTDEYKEAMEDKVRADKKAREQARLDAQIKEAEKQWDAPVKGKKMQVFKGRKVPKGTEGEVIWVGASRYGRGLRVGLKDAEGTVHWTDAVNVRNAAPFQYTVF